MTSGTLERRLAVLEAANPTPGRGMPFLWPAGQSLDDALAFAGLSLGGGLVFPIELVGLTAEPGVTMVCPVHERDRRLLS